MPRFVILHHATPPGYERPTHWDLMLEHDGELLTWALPSDPLVYHDQLADQLANHRLHYLNYEGPVSNDRGQVRRIARGELVWAKFEATRLIAKLNGDIFAGEIELALSESAPKWRVRYTPTPAPNPKSKI